MIDNEKNAVIGSETVLELVAGQHPNGEVIVEKILVNPLTEEHHYQLLKSPLFVKGIAQGDVIRWQAAAKGSSSIVQHGGNLCIKIFSKHDFGEGQLAALEQSISSEIEKLGGDRDLKEARALVYSIHVSCGFNTIEKMLDDLISPHQDVVWYYGNVYDAESGEPMNWWQAILTPE